MDEQFDDGLSSGTPNDLDSFWIPFTPNRQFKKNPRIVVSAKGMHYTSHDGRRILDGSAGLWCANLGHCHPKVVAAVQKAIGTLDFAPSFQFSHSQAFELASRVASHMPGDLNRVFFCNSGSEAVDTALKIALAYHRARGDAGRYRLIGRERGYHGVGFGGIAVGGMVANRRTFGPTLAGVDHLPHTLNLEHNAFSRGQPAWGAHLADDLERLVALHDASTIAAVIVEPVAGSIGVYPPPVGYLQKLREICDKHGILLIFDEVITAWGRLGKASAAEVFGVTPDLMTSAKGLTSAHVPMGAVIARDVIYDTLMEAAGGPDNQHMIELFHGYTYSAHPIAAAAGIATLETYREEGIFERVAENARYFEDALHAQRDLPGILDIRNIGYMGALELEPLAGGPGKRTFEIMVACYERGVMIRISGDTIAFSPPLVAERAHLDEMIGTVADVVRAKMA
ncbi:MAG: aspartate aminotransferase family protein [Rhizobiales bacterium]|nr:aspartate aminotransferase family protein [Hyphomicrobiales bacterium]